MPTFEIIFYFLFQLELILKKFNNFCEYLSCMISRIEQSMQIKFDSNIEKNSKDVESAIQNTRNWALSIIKVKHNGEVPKNEEDEIERILEKFRLTRYAQMTD